MSIVLHLTGTRRDRGGPGRQKTRGEPMNGMEIVTNPELHVESKNTSAEELPTMKTLKD